MNPSRQRQAGVGLVTAIFLLVVIAGLAAAMVTIFTSQQATSQLDMQGTRAYQAARAGIDWGVFRQTQAGSCTGATFALPAASTLAGFTVTVTCTLAINPDPALNRYVIRATACNQPDANGCSASQSNNINNLDYVQRVVEVQL